MKRIISLGILIIICTSSCVQKSYKKTVNFTLKVSNIKDIKKVGIRGNGNFVSSYEDHEMKEVIKDSVYTATIVAESGYKIADFKFVVNGEKELKDKPSRKITFLNKEENIHIECVFDKN